jgi:hypothetical protein
MKYAKCEGINAKFTSFVLYEDLKALYSACDIFVLPSFEEGLRSCPSRGYDIWKALNRLESGRNSNADKARMERLFGRARKR